MLRSSNHVRERIDGPRTDGAINGGGGVKKKPGRRYLVKLPPWQLARTCMVAFLAVGLLSNIVAHYVFRVTWHRCGWRLGRGVGVGRASFGVL